MLNGKVSIMSDPRHILFYDGECGICNASVRLLMRIDKEAQLYYAPLQGQTANQNLPIELRDPKDLSTVVYLRNESEGPELMTQFRAITQSLLLMGKGWAALGRVLDLFPSQMMNWLYGMIARNRHRIRKKGACALPTEEQRKRLLP